GVLYIEIGEFDQAEPHLLASLTVARELGRTTTIIANLVNLAELYAKRGDFDQSRAAVDECFSIASDLDDGNSQIWCHEAAVEHFRESGDRPLAIANAQRALVLSQQFELQQHTVDNARALSSLLVAAGNYAEAQQMGELAISGMDQIRESLLKLRLEQIDAIRDYERAQAEVGALQLRNAYAERQKLLLYLGLGLLVPLLGISLWLLRSKGRLVKELAGANAFNRQLARTDPLTGLPNRRAFIERIALEHAREQGDRQGYSVLMVDIDHFKAFNDGHGHEAGDQVLRHVAASLAHDLPEGSMAARWGGEEFVVLVAGPDHGAERYAQQLTRTLHDDPAIIHSIACPVTLSIGIACSRGRDPMQVVAAADATMYEAKVAGRNRMYREEEVCADRDVLA
ncbi:diguanylate cyclase, partial [Dokdonella sp.]|uniref:diguanylate cyclase n=1 Tax=Dokdonella sp. TaxID=2291710 RepID=UPI003C3E57DB